ncbi:hypothetical protein DBR23_11935 [Acidovorax sp. HMWF018]|uniref:Rha family transcriptional regulator n=1 Tax=Acidovorax sp. HMWF018 TaxID=2056855 RepID=UPI000D39EE0E|nr:Rha family transcriptional regulator [Acidovorax sp. HMWF018]PTT39158.1 hypothetical protein DBR23_11935 [Acidovorax sp. HMWF018]
MNDLSEFVVLNDTTLTTDSRRVAKHFKKLHKNVLRAFDQLDCSDEFRRLNFEPTLIEVPGPNGSTRMERIVRMTKDGFVFLAMGFRGSKAARIKEAYILAFNAMAEQLQRIGMSLWDQRLELEKKDATSFMWASFGSKLMLNRKHELPDIRETRERLQHDMEPGLFPTTATTH